MTPSIRYPSTQEHVDWLEDNYPYSYGRNLRFCPDCGLQLGHITPIYEGDAEEWYCRDCCQYYESDNVVILPER